MHVDHLLLESQRSQVNCQNLHSQQQSCWLAEIKCCPKKGQGGAVIHGRICNVKRERLHAIVHENPKVVPKVCSCYAECPHAGKNQNIPNYDKGVSCEDKWGRDKQRVCRLVP